MAVFTGKDLAHEARRGFIDHQGFPRQGARVDVPQHFEAPLAGFNTVAIKDFHTIAWQPGRPFPLELSDQGLELPGTIADQRRRGGGLDPIELVVDRDEGGAGRLGMIPIRCADRGLDPKDDLTENVINRRKQQGPCILLLGRPGKPGIKSVRSEDAFQCATHHHRNRTFFHKTVEYFAQHGGLLQQVWIEGLDGNKKEWPDHLNRAGVYDPVHGWQNAENIVLAGEYQAFALDVAGIAVRHVQTLQSTLTAMKTALETQALSALSTEDVLGNLLSGTLMSYFAINDIAAQMSASVAGVVAYRQPSYGRVTAVARPQYWFGIPHMVSFPGIEMDIDRLGGVVVSKENRRETQIAFTQESGLRQSALEHLIPEKLFTDARFPGESISAVKALMVASSQGQRLATLTQENVGRVLPLLHLDPQVAITIQEAVATGKRALVSQAPVTIGGWMGMGYIILDPETGSGAYLISGGANGGLLLGGSIAALAGAHFVPAATIVAAIVAPLLILLGAYLLILGLILYLMDGGEFDIVDGLGAIAVLDASFAFLVFFGVISVPLFPVFAIATAAGALIWMKTRFF